MIRSTVKLLATAALLAGAGSAAQAADFSAVRPAFGNTVLATYPDGRSQKIWLHPDGAYDAIGRNGRPNSGRWSLKGDKVCLKQSKPIFIPLSYCTDFPAQGGVGASWAGKDFQGVPINFVVLRGMPTADHAASH